MILYFIVSFILWCSFMITLRVSDLLRYKWVGNIDVPTYVFSAFLSGIFSVIWPVTLTVVTVGCIGYYLCNWIVKKILARQKI